MAAGDSTAPESSRALEELCRAYWYPLYAHIRGRGFSPEDAQDLTQDFISSLLRRKSLTSVAPERGRFRSYLLAALKYFLADHLAAGATAKRGGGNKPLSLDAMSPENRYALEPVSTESPDVLFDRRWSSAMMERVLRRLAEEAGSGDTHFAALKSYLATEPQPGEYEALATQCGISANAIAQQVRRLRQRCKKLLLAEVAHTVAVPSEAEDELRALFGGFRQSSLR